MMLYSISSMVPVNFNQLYYFWVTARSGSITSAARSLLLSPSTVSQQVKQLETALGKRLLSRTRQGVTLTDAGRVTLAYCERLYPQTEELLALLRSETALRSPLIRAGVSRFISQEKILGLTRFVRQHHKDATVKIVSGTSDDLRTMLERCVVDIALCDTDLSLSIGRTYRARLAASIPHYFVAASGGKIPRKPFPAILADMPLMLRSPENPIRQEVDYFLRRNGIVPNIIAEVENPDLILTMVLQDDGIGVLDPNVTAEYEDSGKVVRLHPRPIGIRENLWLLCRQQPLPQAPAQAILQALMDGFRFSHPGLR